jgi:hypothetical protein
MRSGLRPDIKDQDTLTLKEAAARFGLPASTLRCEGARGKLMVYRIGKKFYTTPADVKQLVRRRRIEFMARACRRHAAVCSRKALRVRDPMAREFWKEKEESWANLEQSYELSAQISFPLTDQYTGPPIRLPVVQAIPRF